MQDKLYTSESFWKQRLLNYLYYNMVAFKSNHGFSAVNFSSIATEDSGPTNSCNRAY